MSGDEGHAAGELTELRDALEQLRVLLDRLGAKHFQEQGLLLVGADGCIAHATRGFTDMLGTPAAGLVGMTTSELATRFDLRRVDTRAEAESEDVSTCTLRRPDGSQRVLRWRTVSLVGADGRVVLFEANATMNFFPFLQDPELAHVLRCGPIAEAAFRELLGLPPRSPHREWEPDARINA